jgi:glycyl-tRNA synthetase
MSNSLENEKLEDVSERVVLRLPAFLAPIKVAVLPLMKKDGLAEKAKDIYNDLRFETQCFYEEKDAIGKRYRRQDAIGTPYCITIDHQTLEDNTVTLRDRDTMQQERISIDNLKKVVAEKTDWRKGLR